MAQLAVVLIRARNPLNIGAAARAMTDFGFSDLRLVTDYPVPFETARSAVDATPVLNAARVYPSVAEAIADCSLVYGTSALGERRLEHPVDLLPTAAMSAAGHSGRTALLFGSEKTGLSNEELSHCHRLLTIPMSAQGISMNLGQAVAVCLYECARISAVPHRALPESVAMVDAAQLQRLQSLLRETLTAAEYDRRFPANVGEQDLRRLLHRLTLTAADAEVWMGMLRQILWKLKQTGAVLR